jgi:dipeptidyl aminopeptidase/acylaminoacyl peptidase
VTTPLLIVHGGLDEPARADETFVALRRLGKEVEYARYEGEQHWEGTWGFANQRDYWERILDWFGGHIGAAAAAARR